MSSVQGNLSKIAAFTGIYRHFWHFSLWSFFHLLPSKSLCPLIYYAHCLWCHLGCHLECHFECHFECHLKHYYFSIQSTFQYPPFFAPTRSIYPFSFRNVMLFHTAVSLIPKITCSCAVVILGLSRISAIIFFLFSLSGFLFPTFFPTKFIITRWVKSW